MYCFGSAVQRRRAGPHGHTLPVVHVPWYLPNKNYAAKWVSIGFFQYSASCFSQGSRKIDKGKYYIYVPSCSSYVAGRRSGLNTEHGALDAKAQAHARFPQSLEAYRGFASSLVMSVLKVEQSVAMQSRSIAHRDIILPNFVNQETFRKQGHRPCCGRPLALYYLALHDYSLIIPQSPGRIMKAPMFLVSSFARGSPAAFPSTTHPEASQTCRGMSAAYSSEDHIYRSLSVTLFKNGSAFLHGHLQTGFFQPEFRSFEFVGQAVSPTSRAAKSKLPVLEIYNPTHCILLGLPLHPTAIRLKTRCVCERYTGRRVAKP